MFSVPAMRSIKRVIIVVAAFALLGCRLTTTEPAAPLPTIVRPSATPTGPSATAMNQTSVPILSATIAVTVLANSETQLMATPTATVTTTPAASPFSPVATPTDAPTIQPAAPSMMAPSTEEILDNLLRDRAETDSPLTLIPLIVDRYPHDTTSFTQGLVWQERQLLIESVGRYGQSALQIVELSTGQIVQKRSLDASYFGEGAAVVDDRIIQLTWKAGIAFVYDLESLQLIDQWTYQGEGWGLCHDGNDLWMSNGSAEITRRQSDTFDQLGAITVQQEGVPITQLNELECVGDYILANVWYSDQIMVIQRSSGIVRAVIDASSLLSVEQRDALANFEAVLNGIAYDDINGRLYLTGKLWPTLFEVELVSADDSERN